MVTFLHYWCLVMPLVMLVQGNDRQCIKVSTCKCTRAVDRASIDLSSLGTMIIFDSLVFWSYDPCQPVTLCMPNNTVAVCKNNEYDSGSLNSSDFITTDNDVSIKYSAAPDDKCKNGRVSHVRLSCALNETNIFQFVAEDSSRCNDNFTLTTKLSCLPTLPTLKPLPTTSTSSSVITTTSPLPTRTTLRSSPASSSVITTTDVIQSSSTQDRLTSTTEPPLISSTSITEPPLISSTSPSSTTSAVTHQSTSSTPVTSSSSLISSPTSTKTTIDIQSTLSSDGQYSSSSTQSNVATSVPISHESIPQTLTSLLSSTSASPPPDDNCIDPLWLICAVGVSVVLGFILGYFIRRYPRQRSDTRALIDNYGMKDF